MDSLNECYDCAICLLLMAEPVILQKCNHAFCLHCLQNLCEFSADTFKCPMCRTEYYSNLFQIDLKLLRQIEKSNPQLFYKRLCVVLKEKNDKTNNLSHPKIKLLYGNTHNFLEQMSECQHQWTLFVKIEPTAKVKELFQNEGDLIENVEFTLDETFQTPKVLVQHPPFILARLGWGIFDVEIKVVFKTKYNIPDLRLIHFLSFEGHGEVKGHMLSLPNY